MLLVTKIVLLVTTIVLLRLFEEQLIKKPKFRTKNLFSIIKLVKEVKIIFTEFSIIFHPAYGEVFLGGKIKIGGNYYFQFETFFHF